MCCDFFRTGFRSSDRRQNPGSFLWDLGVTTSVVITGDHNYRVAMGPRPGTYPTGRSTKHFTFDGRWGVDRSSQQNHTSLHSHKSLFSTQTPITLLYTATNHTSLQRHQSHFSTKLPITLLYTATNHSSLHSHQSHFFTQPPITLL
jgi:hypothetical protein